MNDKISKKRKAKITLLNAFVYLSTGIIILMLIGIIGYVFYRGLPNLSFDFLTSTPSLIKDTAGILPNILNTVYIILMTLVIVLPIGVGAAIYLNEYAKNKRFVRVIELATETLSGIPSIIYGLVGMLIFVQFCSLGTSLIAGALTLVIMTLPTIIRTTQESLLQFRQPHSAEQPCESYATFLHREQGSLHDSCSELFSGFPVLF